ncbi:MAG: 5-oxoprolinase [Sphingobacterium sp.]|uniref:hypothetical protein n=1 Tax=Sphingobacterium sp. JB170 TaxID=1434842 RepID=UPI00097ECD9B|nr:hypothetical protein [Sphingobacterium sp. JB170]SJN48331.1 hypothetical protein FM107_16985 [Sphingobacterium sp. JB170]
MSPTVQLSHHLLEKFPTYSISELITLNNDIVENRGWGPDRSTFRNAILKALVDKGVDISPIISKEDGFTVIQVVKVKLEKNTLLPAC